MANPGHTSQTVRALLARGLDYSLAVRLAEAGHTVGSLKQGAVESLARLGLTEEFIENLHSEARPPIPEELLICTLYEARWVCCVCRDPAKSVIVHHIISWSESRSHDLNNLVVLCLHHHDEAHARREIALSLTPARIREFKAKWLQEVRERDAEAITRRTYWAPMFWDYFNHSRLNDLVNDDPDLQRAHAHKLVALTDVDERYYLYEGDLPLAHSRRAEYSNVVVDIMRRNGFISLNSLDPGEIFQILERGRVVALNARWRFARVRPSPLLGPGQIRKARAIYHDIAFKFTIDAWEATSASAYSSRLVDENTELLAILYIRAVASGRSRKEAQATCLAIGTESKGVNWSPDRTEPLPLVGQSAGPEVVYCHDSPSACRICDGALGVLMYDAEIRGRSGYVCQACFCANKVRWYQKYERTFEAPLEWLLVERGSALGDNL